MVLSINFICSNVMCKSYDSFFYGSLSLCVIHSNAENFNKERIFYICTFIHETSFFPLFLSSDVRSILNSDFRIDTGSYNGKHTHTHSHDCHRHFHFKIVSRPPRSALSLSMCFLFLLNIYFFYWQYNIFYNLFGILNSIKNEYRV